MGMNLTDLRFDHPRAFWICTVALTLGVGIGVFLVLPQNSFFEAVGVNEAQRRVFALKNAGYWYSRSLIHASAEDLTFDTRYGNVLHFADGQVTASLPNGDRFEKTALYLADVVVVVPELANQTVQDVRFKDARFEIYDRDKSVVWIGNKPLNITLIEVGAAQPDPNPPTNIVDIAFASYYWNQVKGESP